MCAKTFCSLGAAWLTLLAGLFSPAAACGPESYAGTICTFAFGYCPSGFLPIDGNTVSYPLYPNLFVSVGTRYGTDGLYRLPDLRGRTAVGSGTGPGLAPADLGKRFGQPTVTLTGVQTGLTGHTHVAELELGSGANVELIAQATGPVVVAIPASAQGGDTAAPGPDTYIAASSQAAELSFAASANTTLMPFGAAADLPVSGVITEGYVHGSALTIAAAAKDGAGSVSIETAGLGLTTCIKAKGELAPRQ